MYSLAQADKYTDRLVQSTDLCLLLLHTQIDRRAIVSDNHWHNYTCLDSRRHDVRPKQSAPASQLWS